MANSDMLTVSVDKLHGPKFHSTVGGCKSMNVNAWQGVVGHFVVTIFIKGH